MKYYEAIRGVVILGLIVGGYFLALEVLQMWNDSDSERQWNHCMKGVTIEGISERKAMDICSNIVP